MQDTHISLAHGNGGRYMRELIDEIFARHLANPELDVQADAVPVDISGGEVLFTTDGFTVQPLEFPGGNIGSLAVHGTTNDLAVAGATPKYLSLNAFIEEGLEIELLERIVKSLAEAAAEIGVKVVAGDTKVLPRGEGGGLYLATTGVGVRRGHRLTMHNINHGDAIIDRARRPLHPAEQPALRVGVRRSGHRCVRLPVCGGGSAGRTDARAEHPPLDAGSTASHRQA